MMDLGTGHVTPFADRETVLLWSYGMTEWCPCQASKRCAVMVSGVRCLVVDAWSGWVEHPAALVDMLGWPGVDVGTLVPGFVLALRVVRQEGPGLPVEHRPYG